MSSATTTVDTITHTTPATTVREVLADYLEIVKDLLDLHEYQGIPILTPADAQRRIEIQK